MSDWHDLIKNPLDLPKVRGHYEVKFLHKKGTIDIELNAFWNMKKWTNFSNNVVAWRENL